MEEAKSLFSISLELSRIRSSVLTWTEKIERMGRSAVAALGAQTLRVTLDDGETPLEPALFVLGSPKASSELEGASLNAPVRSGGKTIGAIQLSGIPQSAGAGLEEFLCYLGEQIGETVSFALFDMENRRLQREIQGANEELAARKLIDRARGILARQRGISEKAALSMLQKHSIASGKRLEAIADAIVTMHVSRGAFIPDRLRIRRTA